MSVSRPRWSVTFFTFFLVAALLFVLTACSADSGEGAETDGGSTDEESAVVEHEHEPVISVSSDTFPLVVTDIDGVETTLEERPQRVVFLSGTPMNIWYDAGGNAIGRPELTDNIKLVEGMEEEMHSLPSVGFPYAVNAEAVAALNPDLIIGMDGPQNVTIERFRDLGYDAVLLKVRSFEDLEDTYRAFGVLAGTSDQANERLTAIQDETEEILAQVPDEERSVVVLFISAANLAVKLDHSIVGEMLADLGVTNIATGLTPDNPGSETTPLNIESIVVADPDQVLVTSMIDSNEIARENLQKEFDSNAGWQAIEAIEEGKVNFLPQQYFLYNAGPYYPDALRYLAASIYPDTFGEPREP